MVNQVTTRSKKREETPPEKPSISKGKKKEIWQKKVNTTDSSTSDSLTKAKAEKRNTCKDDIFDMIRKALKGMLTKPQAIPSALTSKEPPKVEVRSSIILPTPGRTPTVGSLINSDSPIVATMEFDLVQNLANTPPHIYLLQQIMTSPHLLKDLITWSHQRRLTRQTR
ncbi:hypothetical protein R1flu_008160 [Riccia fluitans]|uniref:Uncharacterized protein n=1 Tax=Riccia fluitans TaxID=41844 RepID=A0ABD1YBJ7_9MARC